MRNRQRSRRQLRQPSFVGSSADELAINCISRWSPRFYLKLISPPFVLVLTAIISIQMLHASRASSAPPAPTVAGSADCRDLDEVTYSKARSEGLRKIDIISLRADADELSKLTGLRRQRSLQGTKTLLMRSADFTHPGPWDTTLYIFGNRARPVRLRITFHDHGNGGVFPQWLNEHLLFAEVWWGRIASTDLIIDVGTSKIIYAEDADYGMVGMPCSEKTKLH